ncbi:MAG: alpha/beta hydrolase, partial [Anaerolineae bacterium]|nr:alpha/beta hydrolase [Anaerolineae bacterium]
MNYSNGFEQHQVTLDGQKIAYLTAGQRSSPPLLMVHGWLSYAGIWDQTLTAFQDRYYGVAIDLLGHGRSDKPGNGDYSIAAHAQRVLALADSLGLDTFSYIGHSMGGQIGLYLALHAPERITRLVSVSGVVTGQLTAYTRYLLKPIYFTGMVFPSIWDFSRFALRYRWYSSIFDYALFYNPPPLDHIDRKMAVLHGVEIPAYRELEAIAAVNLSDRLSGIQLPTRAIFGKNDRTVAVENGYLLEKHVPGAKLV